MIYAIKAYNKPVCIMSEFEEDIKRIKYVKRLIKKYLDKGDLRERLILNHIIILSNTFGTEATVRMLFYKLTSNYYPVIKTCLLFLNYMPKVVYGINGKDLNSSDITIDMELGKRLRNI
jgi:hypothetical protein